MFGACSSCECDGWTCVAVGTPEKYDAEVVLPVASELMLAADERRAAEPVAVEMLPSRWAKCSSETPNSAGNFKGGEKR